MGNININVNGVTEEEYTSSDQITVVGGGIRTSGNQGIRFKCKNEYTRANTLEFNYEIKEYGAWIAFGSKDSNGNELTSDVIETAYENNSKINNYNIMDAYVTETDEDGIYYVTVYNIPDDCYLQDITIVPYVNVYRNSPYTTECIFKCGTVYGSTALSRNIGEIALAFLNDGGTTSTLISDVVDTLESDYRINYSDSIGSLFVGSCVYETDTYNIYKQFARDWNKDYPSNTLPTTITATNFLTTVNSVMRTSYIDYANSNLVNFFSNHSSKYMWLLDVLAQSVYDDDESFVSSVNYIKGTGEITDANWNYGNKIIYCLMGFLAQVDASSYGGINHSNSFSDYCYFTRYGIINRGMYRDLINNDETIVNINSEVAIGTTAGNYNMWHSVEFSRTSIKQNNYLPSSAFKITDDGYYYCLYQINDTSSVIVLPSRELTDITLSSNMTYKGNGTTTLYGDINITGGSNNIVLDSIIFDDAQIINTYESTATGAILSSITFKNCTIKVDTDKTFIDWTATDSSYYTDITFENCTFTSLHTESSAVYAENFVCITNTQDISFTNCSFSYCDGSSIKLEKSTNGCGQNGAMDFSSCTFNYCLNKIIYIDYLDLEHNATINLECSGLYYETSSLTGTTNQLLYINKSYFVNESYFNNDFSKVIITFDSEKTNLFPVNPHIAGNSSSDGHVIKCTYNGGPCKITSDDGLLSD